MTTIDALRLIADRTNCYAPGGDTEYGPNDATWGAPEYAKVFVCKLVAGTWHQYSGQAFFGEYVQLKFDKKTATSMWKKMPRTMIAKCAEALALRRGFPNDLAGLYSHEELMQSDNVASDEAPKFFGDVPRKASEGGQGGGAGREIAAPPNPEQPKPKQTDFPHGHNLTSPDVAAPSAPVVSELSPGVPNTPPAQPEAVKSPPIAIIPPATPPVSQKEPLPKRDKCISKPKQTRLWAIMGTSKWHSKEDLKTFLKTIKTQDHPDGLESTSDIPDNIYEVVCAWIEGGK
jgi:hypothetical protein